VNNSGGRCGVRWVQQVGDDVWRECKSMRGRGRREKGGRKEGREGEGDRESDRR